MAIDASRLKYRKARLHPKGSKNACPGNLFVIVKDSLSDKSVGMSVARV